MATYDNSANVAARDEIIRQMNANSSEDYLGLKDMLEFLNREYGPEASRIKAQNREAMYGAGGNASVSNNFAPPDVSYLKGNIEGEAKQPQAPSTSSSSSSDNVTTRPDDDGVNWGKIAAVGGGAGLTAILAALAGKKWLGKKAGGMASTLGKIAPKVEAAAKKIPEGQLALPSPRHDINKLSEIGLSVKPPNKIASAGVKDDKAFQEYMNSMRKIKNVPATNSILSELKMKTPDIPKVDGIEDDSLFQAYMNSMKNKEKDNIDSVLGGLQMKTPGKVIPDIDIVPKDMKMKKPDTSKAPELKVFKKDIKVSTEKPSKKASVDKPKTKVEAQTIKVPLKVGGTGKLVPKVIDDLPKKKKKK